MAPNEIIRELSSAIHCSDTRVSSMLSASLGIFLYIIADKTFSSDP